MELICNVLDCEQSPSFPIRFHGQKVLEKLNDLSKETRSCGKRGINKNNIMIFIITMFKHGA